VAGLTADRAPAPPTKRSRVGAVAALLVLPLVYEVCCAALALGVVAAKWVIMGRFYPFQHPQWSWYVWRLAFVNALYEFMISPLALNALQGTPFLPWYYRLLGARIGRRTYFHTTGLIEFDLVEVGDEAVLNEDSVLQARISLRTGS
jgi:non-ribosomal peptide synthetase-like protein